MANAKTPTYGDGKICYVEIPAKDVEESADFYKKIFGWKIKKRKDGATAFDDAVGEVSGTFVTGRKAHPDKGLIVYLMVDDMDATLEKIISNGGKVVEAVGTVPKMITAKFGDPAGNVFGLYQQE